MATPNSSNDASEPRSLESHVTNVGVVTSHNSGDRKGDETDNDKKHDSAPNPSNNSLDEWNTIIGSLQTQNSQGLGVDQLKEALVAVTQARKQVGCAEK